MKASEYDAQLSLLSDALSTAQQVKDDFVANNTRTEPVATPAITFGTPERLEGNIHIPFTLSGEPRFGVFCNGARQAVAMEGWGNDGTVIVRDEGQTSLTVSAVAREGADDESEPTISEVDVSA